MFNQNEFKNKRLQKLLNKMNLFASINESAMHITLSIENSEPFDITSK